VRFHTDFGQTLSVLGNIPALGQDKPADALLMNYFNNDYWQLSIDIDPLQVSAIHYNYILTYPDGFQVIESGDDREVAVSKGATQDIQLVDTWNYSGEYENVFFTAPFHETLLKPNETKNKVKSPKNITHIFRVKAPLLKKNEVVCLSGTGITLGDWHEPAVLPASREGNWWTVKINLPREEFPLQYKYGVYNIKEKTFVQFESGENRFLYGDDTANKLTILHDGFVHLPNTGWRGAGVAIPVFSLRSKDSFGVGEFRDMKLLADWSKKTGLKLIQILPVNDTMAMHTWVDSYPYAAISAFALHPIYICLEDVAGKKHAPLIKSLKKKQKELNDLPELDYEEVMKCKLAAIKELYLLEKEEVLKDRGFADFFMKNQHWLVPYAAFCCLRDKNNTSDFNQWKQHSRYDKAAIEKFVSPKAKHFDEIALQYFTQYHLHLQLKEATEYAHKNGVIVKGDIPIGIYRHSCDAWINPALYNMDVQAGAPPDDFAVKGQNWGFPTYNWQKMEEDGYAWWKQRFDEMSYYFDAFRIDHILGFFRIWSVPINAVEGIMGRFVPALPVHVNEFHERGIWFDHHRYTVPFITDAVLWEVFGDLEQFIKEEFLAEGGYGQFALREAYDTQRKVEDYFAGVESNDHNHRLKQGLFDLISNVLLFEHEGSNGTQFHFRISMDHTTSFRALDAPLQQQLKDLYINYFYYRQDEFWRKEAMHKLPALKASTNMLICGEDLGMVPHCVPDVMKQLGILSLEIQRMPKDPRKEFFHPADAPYLSVVTPSTHDMSTIRGWWEEDRVRTQRFFTEDLGQWGEAPYFCEAWINRAIVNQHLHSPSMWSIFLWQDLLGMSETLRRPNPHEERINVPSIPKYYWRYRMHLSFEQLLKEKEFNHELKQHVAASGR
ncbi:MAG TPA: 4-alpha-glucanotransferase, partial [Chitinophagaceae bacterium]